MTHITTTRKRRRFLALAGGTVTLAALSAVIPVLRRTENFPLPGGMTARAPVVSLSATDTIVDFLGSLFGRSLTAADRLELSDRVSYASIAEEELGSQLSFLVRDLDTRARGAGRDGFSRATAEQQFAIVDAVMRMDTKALHTRPLWRFSPSDRARSLMRTETIPRLALLYRSSGVPWRARGYVRWPGIPGAWDEYTRPGAPYPRG